MLRRRAVRSMLIEDIANLHFEPNEDESPEEEAEEQSRLLDQAISRATWVVVIDWVAIAVLFLTRQRGTPFLPTEISTELVMTVGILVVAVHSGFRLAQRLQLKSVQRKWEELT